VPWKLSSKNTSADLSGKMLRAYYQKTKKRGEV
jgi:hypothetical protein